MRIEIYFDCDNDSFARNPSRAIADVFFALAGRMNGWKPMRGDGTPIYDVDGNIIGRMEVK